MDPGTEKPDRTARGAPSPDVDPLPESSTTDARTFDSTALVRLLSYFGAERTNGLLDTFANELARYCTTVADAGEHDDWSAIAHAAHTIRGTALTFGCADLVSLCDALRDAGLSMDGGICRTLAERMDRMRREIVSDLNVLRRPGGLLQP